MVRFRILGTIDLRDARGAEVRTVLVQPRRLGLLAALAMARPTGFVRRDLLLALFWPESDRERARAALNRATYFLRRALGEGVVVSRGVEELGLARERIWCDVDAFDAAIDTGDVRRALDLYRGDVLTAFHLSGADGFEEFLEQARRRLRSRAVDAARHLLDSEEAAGRFDAAAHWAERMVDLAPYEESAVQRLVRLLDRAGDRARAAEVYQRFSADIESALGVDPSPETKILMRDIRARTPAWPVRPATDDARSGEPSSEGGGHPARAHPRRRRAAMGVLVVAAAVTAVFASRRVSTTDPIRIDVAAFESPSDEPAADRWADLASRRAFAGLVQAGLIRTTAGGALRTGWRDERIPDSVRQVRSRAGTLITGRTELRGETLSVRAWITDRRQADRVWALVPVNGTIDDAEQILRVVQQRIAGGVAALANPEDARVLPVASNPPLAEAYREYREGVRLELAMQRTEAVRRFRLATALDDSFSWPLVTAALIGATSFRARDPGVDSLVDTLVARRERLSALERHLVDYVRAVRSEDWPGSYAAIRNAAVLAPDRFSYLEAVRAMTLHRPHEAVAALTRPHLDSIYRDDAKSYWFVLTLAYHVLGEHRRELAAVRSARRHAPASASLVAQEMRALAAMGNTHAVMVLVDTLLVLPRDDWLTGGAALRQVAAELRAHGHPAEAASVLARCVTWFSRRPSVEAGTEGHDYMLGLALYEAGRLADADTLYRRLHAEYPDNAEYLGYLGAIAARRGDHRAAQAVAARLVTRAATVPLPGEDSMVWRARIAALLGDNDAAMRLLIDAFGPQGTPELHESRDFDAMADYPPFREFIRPKG